MSDTTTELDRLTTEIHRLTLLNAQLLAACETALTMEPCIDERVWYASSQCPRAFREIREAVLAAK